MSKQGESRIAYYDGIRALAIGAVVVYHWVQPYVPHFLGGYVGVDVFFVLSGFIITTILWRRPVTMTTSEAYRRFLVARVLRLYPALLGFLAGATLIVWLFGRPVPVGEAVTSAALAAVQAGSIELGLGLHGLEPYAQTWSLSVEWCFYLVWPLVLLACRRRGVAPDRLAGAALAGAALLYVASLPTSGLWFYFGPTARIPQILVGCAVGLLLLSERPLPHVEPRVVDAAVAVSVAFIAAWTVAGPLMYDAAYRWVGYPLTTAAAVVLCLAPALAEGCWAHRLLSVRPLAMIGLVSYSLYLWHLLAIQVLDKNVVHLPMPVLGLLGVLMTAVLTLLSYRWLERPFTHARGSALRSRRPVRV